MNIDNLVEKLVTFLTTQFVKSGLIKLFFDLTCSEFNFTRQNSWIHIQHIEY